MWQKMKLHESLQVSQRSVSPSPEAWQVAAQGGPGRPEVGSLMDIKKHLPKGEIFSNIAGKFSGNWSVYGWFFACFTLQFIC